MTWPAWPAALRIAESCCSDFLPAFYTQPDMSFSSSCLNAGADEDRGSAMLGSSIAGWTRGWPSVKGDDDPCSTSLMEFWGKKSNFMCKCLKMSKSTLRTGSINICQDRASLITAFKFTPRPRYTGA